VNFSDQDEGMSQEPPTSSPAGPSVAEASEEPAPPTPAGPSVPTHPWRSIRRIAAFDRISKRIKAMKKPSLRKSKIFNNVFSIKILKLQLKSFNICQTTQREVLKV
jgi:hypothetical protein